MPVSRKRKTRGKGVGADERRRRIRQRNAEIRGRHRRTIPFDDHFAAMSLLGLVRGLR